jgi:AraC-like DNA-binding protein
MAPGLSLRAYESERVREQFCVSTQSSELTLLLEGEIWVEMGPARQQVRILPEQACLIYRGTPHQMHTAEGSRFLVLDVDAPVSWLGATCLEGGLLSPALVRGLPHLWEASSPQLTEGFRQQLTTLLDRFAASVTPLETTHNTLRMLDVKRHLEEHSAEPLDLGVLARRFGLDRFYLLRAFKQNFGTPPLAYVSFLRMEHFVWTMLREGRTRELIEVSGEAGFSDYSTFCRRIRRRLGRPPSQLIAPAPDAEI